MTFNLSYKKTILFAAIAGCSYLGSSQKPIPELRADLQIARSADEKADICFFISLGHASRLKIDSALFYAEKVKQYSVPVNYETGMGKYYLAISTAITYRRKYSEGKENVSTAIKILSRQKDKTFLGMAYHQMGIVQQALGHTDSSRMYHWYAIHYLESMVNSSLAFSPYFELARSYYNTSDFDSAAYYDLKALQIAEATNNLVRIFNTGTELGRAFLRLKDLQNAYKYLDNSIRKYGKNADPISYWIELNEYANCLILAHDFLNADSVIKQFETTANKLKEPWGYVIVNKLKGIYEYEKRNYSKALDHLTTAYKSIDEIDGNNPDIQDIVFTLGKTEFQLRKYDSAIVHLRFASAFSHLIKFTFDEAEADLLLSKAFEMINKPDSALKYFIAHSSLKDSVLSLQKQKTIIEVSAKYETEKKEQEIKILEKEKEANFYSLQLKNQQIEKQELESEKRSQQLQLLSQQSEISRLEAARKNLAFQNQGKEMIKKQRELESISQENQLRKDIAVKENQQKWIAYGAVLAVLIFGSFAFFRYRQSRKLSKQLAASLISLKEAQEQLIKTEKEKESENVRVRISRDIHDEVGATLSGVALYSEIAKQKMEEHKEKDAQIYLNHISANSKEMVEKMSDIVWAINPDNDSFERIIAKLQSYAFNLCAGKGIALHMNLGDTVSTYYPPMQVKRNLYLFMKEAINNAVKYSEAKNISLSLQSKGDTIIAEIKDDGKGFDTSLNYMGNGLKNMKARADSVEGDFAIESAEGKGTCIRLGFQFHPTGGQLKKA